MAISVWKGEGGFARRTWPVGLLLCVGLGLLAWWPLAAVNRPARQNIVLVAREMAFYLEGQSTPNPTLVVPAGADVRIELRNQDPGVTHDFAIRSLKVAIKPLKGEGTGFVRFKAPERPGRYDYLCNPHALMMSGTLEVK
jgi:heme/copper-type cytochrome/quinol oxidase subunit 2